MPSPLPGMDPYLEDPGLWPAFHHQFIMCLYQILLPTLVDRYRARVCRRSYRVEQVGPGAASADERHEDYIEVRLRSDGRLVTLMDLVNPANKTTESGRAAYLETRRAAHTSNANLVEIDLVLQGSSTLEYSREGLPDWDYAVTATRATQPERYEIYTSTLQKRLPRFKLPLAAADRESVLDLQTALARCFDQGGFGSKIDYKRDPTTPLDEEDIRWLDTVLVRQELRDRLPSDEEIALAAYYLWEQDGRPYGRDLEHWCRAADHLRWQATTGRKAP